MQRHNIMKSKNKRNYRRTTGSTAALNLVTMTVSDRQRLWNNVNLKWIYTLYVLDNLKLSVFIKTMHVASQTEVSYKYCGTGHDTSALS